MSRDDESGHTHSTRCLEGKQKRKRPVLWDRTGEVVDGRLSWRPRVQGYLAHKKLRPPRTLP